MEVQLCSELLTADKHLNRRLAQILRSAQLVREVQLCAQRLPVIEEEEVDYYADVDSDADTVVLDEELENLPPLVPLKRQTAVACE